MVSKRQRAVRVNILQGCCQLVAQLELPIDAEQAAFTLEQLKATTDVPKQARSGSSAVDKSWHRNRTCLKRAQILSSRAECHAQHQRLEGCACALNLPRRQPPLKANSIGCNTCTCTRIMQQHRTFKNDAAKALPFKPPALITRIATGASTDCEAKIQSKN